MTQPVKNLPAIQEIQKTWVQSLDWEDLPEAKMATYSSIVAWEIPRREEPGGLQSIESQRVGLSSVMPDSLRPYGLTVFFQAPLSMGFSRQQYQKVPFLPPGDLPDPGIEPAPPALAGAFFITEPPGKLLEHLTQHIRQMLTAIKGEMNSNTIVGDVNTHLYQWKALLGRK